MYCLCSILGHTVAVASRKTIPVQKGAHTPSNVALSKRKAPGALALQRAVNTVLCDRGLGIHAWTCDVLFRKQN